MYRLILPGLAVLLTAIGCVGDVPPDASLSDVSHPANPDAPAATRPTFDEPAATPTSAPAPAPMGDMRGMHHHDHGGAR